MIIKKLKSMSMFKKILLFGLFIAIILGVMRFLKYKGYIFNDDIYESFSKNINLGIKNSFEECRDAAGDCILYYYVSDENSPNHKKCFCFRKEDLIKAFTDESLSDESKITNTKILELSGEKESEGQKKEEEEEENEVKDGNKVDCKGSWTPCNGGCIKKFTVEEEPKNNGKSCPDATKDKGSDKIIIPDSTNSDGKRVIHQICEPGEDSSSWHDYMCDNKNKDESKLNSGCKGFTIDEINDQKRNSNDNIEVKTVQPAAKIPGPSWIDVKGSTGARSMADFGAYKKDLGCYLKYDNFGAGARAHGNENLKMNGVVIGSEEEVKNLCAERCYASKDCNYFQTWSRRDNEKLETSQPYSCCLYSIDENNIPKNSDQTPYVGNKGKGKMWKIRNIRNKKVAIFGESNERRGVVKRVYKIDTIPIKMNGENKNVCGEDGKSECRVDRESEDDIKYKMRAFTPKCNLGSTFGLKSGSEVKDDSGNDVIEQYENLCDNSKLRILLLILIICIIIYCL